MRNGDDPPFPPPRPLTPMAYSNTINGTPGGRRGFVVDGSLTGDNVKGVKHCLGVNDLDLVR